MITLLAVTAVVLLLAVLVSLSRSGSADLLGAAPFGSDRPSAWDRVEQSHDTDARRARADLEAMAAHVSR